VANIEKKNCIYLFSCIYLWLLALILFHGIELANGKHITSAEFVEYKGKPNSGQRFFIITTSMSLFVFI